MSAKHLTDEQRVARYIAGLPRSSRQRMPLWYVENACMAYWRERGVVRSASTWLRAFWRAVREGMLGEVEKLPRQSSERFHRYRIHGTKRAILRAAGVEYRVIPHGKRKGGDAA